jgi:hypothetical protein
MNVEIGTETPIVLFWEYLFRSFGILSLQCSTCNIYRAKANWSSLVVPFFIVVCVNYRITHKEEVFCKEKYTFFGNKRMKA